MRKKALSVLLALAMVLSLGSVAFATDADIRTNAVSELGDMTGKTVILHSNDVHGAIAGYAYMAQLKADYEKAGAEVILVDDGDFTNGNTYVSTSKGASAVELMNLTGYDVVALGNHELDFGYDQLKSNFKNAKFKVLCADVVDEKGKTIFDANYTYVTKSGLKIGFFGIETPETQTKVNPATIKGLTFMTETSTTTIWKCAQNQVDALKDADLVIALAHLGVDAESAGHQSYDLLANTTGIDFVIDGHSHTVMTTGECGEKIQSTGTQFANIGVIVIDNASKKIEDNYLVPFTAPVYDKTAKTLTYTESYDQTVADAALKIMNDVEAKYGTKFAVSEVTLNGAKAPNGNRDSETNNGDLITDAIVWSVLKDGKLDVDDDHVVGITNGGGIRAAIAEGDVTMNDIKTVLPFGNTVAVVYVKGSELLEALEASCYACPDAIGGFPQVNGIEFTINTAVAYDANAETYPGSTYYGPKTIQRVKINSINGKEFSLTDTYAVVTNNFCAAGGDTYYAFAAASSQFDTGIPMDEAVMDYVKTQLKGVIGEEYAEPQGRILINPFADVQSAAWFSEYVVALYNEGIINGTSATSFNPAGTLTWAEALKLMLVANGDLASADAVGDSWATNTIACAAKLGLVDASLDGSKSITRLEFCQIAAKLYNIAASTDTSVFADCTDGSVMALYEANVINGKSTTGNKLFDPSGILERSEISKIIYLLNELDNAA